MKPELEQLADSVCAKYDYDAVNLLPILQEIQRHSPRNYISEEMARIIAKKLDITESRGYDVITYFSVLSSEPRGEVIIQICDSTTCTVNINKDLIRWFEEELGIKVGETTPDNKFTLIFTHCFGACDVSPAVRIEDDVYGMLTREKVKDLIAAKRWAVV